MGRKPKLQLSSDPRPPTQQPTSIIPDDKAVFSLISDYGSDDEETQDHSSPPSNPNTKDDKLADFLQEIEHLTKPDPTSTQTKLQDAHNLQEDWQACVEFESGNIYFWNTTTNEVVWDRPANFSLPETISQFLISKKGSENHTIAALPPSTEDKQSRKRARSDGMSETVSEKFSALRTETRGLKKRVDAIPFSAPNSKEITSLVCVLCGAVEARCEDWTQDNLEENVDAWVVMRRIGNMSNEYEQLKERVTAIEQAVEQESKLKKQQVVQRPAQLYSQPSTQTLQASITPSEPHSATTATDMYATTTSAPLGWVSVLDSATNTYYYHNYILGITQWEPPTAAQIYSSTPTTTPLTANSNPPPPTHSPESESPPPPPPPDKDDPPPPPPSPPHDLDPVAPTTRALSPSSPPPISSINTDGADTFADISLDRAQTLALQAKAVGSVIRQPKKDKKVSTMISQWKARQAEMEPEHSASDSDSDSQPHISADMLSGSNTIPLGSDANVSSSGTVSSWRTRVARSKQLQK